MRKLLFGALGLATLGLVILPSFGQAGGVDFEPGRGVSALTSWVSAVDVHGDANAIGKFNSAEGNKHYVKVEGSVTAISSTAITVLSKSKSKSYTFTIDSTTKIIRKFKGTAAVSEVQVGDAVRVYATALTSGTAKLIWDKSIWWVSLSGTLANLDSTAKTFNLIVSRKEPQTGLTMTLTVPVKTTDTTTYWLADGTAKAWTDLANDQKINVRGSWDVVNKIVTASRVTIKS